MVVISETSGDGSDGSDPNKNPQEVEKIQNENPQEVEEENENLPIPQEHSPELIQDLAALAAKAFLRVISSPELFDGLTEPVLYALIGFPPLITPSWYILRRSNIPLRLSKISSLPHMIPGSTAVTIGHKIYVFGGYDDTYQPLTNVIVIDCRFHTWQNLPGMQRARYYAAAGVIDGKIYVIGGRKKQDNDWVEVFDVERGIWETVPGLCPNDANESGLFSTYVVMQEKIFILDHLCCLAYEPRRGLWQSWGVRSELKRLWSHSSSFVVGDLLYTLDHTCSLGYPIVVYYPSELVWRPVMAVHSSHLPMLSNNSSKMANFDGKLVVLGCYGNDIWCIEIALETRQGGQIWGNVVSTTLVLEEQKLPSIIELCPTITGKKQLLSLVSSLS